MGICVFNAADPDSCHDLRRNLIPYCVRHHRVHAQNHVDSLIGEAGKPTYWRDLSTLDAYWAANMDLVQVTPQLDLYGNDWPIWTWQPQSPPAKFVHDEDGRRGSAVDSVIGDGCVVSGATVRRSMLFSDVRIHSHALVQDAIILSNVQVGADCVLKKCIVDKNCSVPDGSVIGVDPVEDARRFHVTEGGVTLVTRVMLGQEASQV